ncbi:MAG TPA: DUF3151 family protein [Candidatus Angelobacter sp.]|jgi:hypothetical protein|nr:DUF3151 family protein [Candidatus Angelobacter sp.]
MSEQPPQGLRPLQVAPGSQPAPAPRHRTVLPDEPSDAVAALDAALASPDVAAALRDVVAHWPAYLDGWARLGQQAWRDGDHPASVYAYARVGYHRGLDKLRRHGWGGTGEVRWAEPGNRGFLRALHMLMVAAAAIGETDEAARCRDFLLELDPEDGLGVASVPAQPGPGWRPDLLP